MSGKKIHRLRNSKLRKVRFELRTLLYLVCKDELLRLQGFTFGERKKFENYFHRSPIACWVCGDRMEDLVRDPDTKFWFCTKHFREL